MSGILTFISLLSRRALYVRNLAPLAQNMLCVLMLCGVCVCVCVCVCVLVCTCVCVY